MIMILAFKKLMIESSIINPENKLSLNLLTTLRVEVIFIDNKVN